MYCHVGENFRYEDAEDEIESNNYLSQKKFKRAYMYNFKNPVLFDIPKKITVLSKTGSLVEFDEKEIQEGYKIIDISYLKAVFYFLDFIWYNFRWNLVITCQNLMMI